MINIRLGNFSHRKKGQPVHLFRWRISLLFLAFSALLQARANQLAHRPDPVIVAYFAHSGVHSNPPRFLRDLVLNGGAGSLDQMNYSRAAVTGGRCSIADPESDLETTYTRQNSVDGSSDDPASAFRGYFHQLKELKRRYPRLRILISLEGTPEDFREDAKPETRRDFVRSCVEIFLRGHFAPGVIEPDIFDGFDVDWEFPMLADAENFQALIEEFRMQMNAFQQGLTLAIAVGDQPQMQPGTDFHKIAPLVDEIGIMNYDYTGPWEPTTGFLAPLFPTADASQQRGSVAESVAAYEEGGIPRQKLLMGIPFYGYQWRYVKPDDHGLFQPGEAVSEGKPYREIRELQSSYSLFRNPRSRAPWLFDGASFWTFEDPISIAYKCRYAASQHLAGIMIWEVSADTAEATLLTAAWRSLHQPPATSIPAEPEQDEWDNFSRPAGGDGAT